MEYCFRDSSPNHHLVILHVIRKHRTEYKSSWDKFARPEGDSFLTVDDELESVLEVED
jgi:hypothetical protein